MKRADIERIAELARLELSDEEYEVLTRDCQAILAYFEAIRGVDVEGATPTGALEQPAPMREDRVDHDELVRPPRDTAPAWRDGYFVLPRLAALDVGDEPGPS